MKDHTRDAEQLSVDYSRLPFKPLKLVRAAFGADRKAWAKLRPLLKPFQVGRHHFVADAVLEAAVLTLAGTAIEPQSEPRSEPRSDSRPAVVTELLSIAEVASRYAVSDSTVRRRIKDGRLPAKLIAGEYRIRPADVDAAVQRQDL